MIFMMQFMRFIILIGMALLGILQASEQPQEPTTGGGAGASSDNVPSLTITELDGKTFNVTGQTVGDVRRTIATQRAIPLDKIRLSTRAGRLPDNTACSELLKQNLPVYCLIHKPRLSVRSGFGDSPLDIEGETVLDIKHGLAAILSRRNRDNPTGANDLRIIANGRELQDTESCTTLNNQNIHDAHFVFRLRHIPPGAGESASIARE